jgi:hypothetical protein
MSLRWASDMTPTTILRQALRGILITRDGILTPSFALTRLILDGSNFIG